MISTAAKGYQLGDEQESTNPTPGAVVQQWANQIRSVDSTRPIYLGMGTPTATFINAGYAGNHITVGDIQAQCNAADFIGADFYGMTSGVIAYPGIWVYGRTVDNLIYWVAGKKPVFGVLETNNPFNEGTGGSDGRVPTAAQEASCVWMMLIHGARGIIYFDHRFYTPADFEALVSGNYPAMAAAVTTLNSQILAVAPALNAPAVTGVAAVASSNTAQAAPADVFINDSNEVMPWGKGPGVQVDFTVRQPGDGFTYIFAIGGNPGATTGTFTLTGVTGTTVTVLNESRTIPVSGGVFSDSFAADYTYHLYQIAT